MRKLYVGFFEKNNFEICIFIYRKEGILLLVYNLEHIQSMFIMELIYHLIWINIFLRYTNDIKFGLSKSIHFNKFYRGLSRCSIT